jgi:hypothetical protein
MTRTQQQQAEWETWRYDQRATEEDLARYARALVRDSALTVTEWQATDNADEIVHAFGKVCVA